MILSRNAAIEEIELKKIKRKFEDKNITIYIVRIGPSVTVYWLGGPSVSDVLQ
jgi:hypothetical protein